MGEQQVREKGQEPAARNVRAQFSSLEASLESSLWRAALRQSERATCVEAGGGGRIWSLLLLVDLLLTCSAGKCPQLARNEALGAEYPSLKKKVNLSVMVGL